MPAPTYIQSLEPTTAKAVAGDIRSHTDANSAFWQWVELTGGPASPVAATLRLGNGSGALGVFLVNSAGTLLSPPFPVTGSLGVGQLGPWSVTVGNDPLRVASGGLLPVVLHQTSGRIPVQIDATSGRLAVQLDLTSGRVPVELANSGDIRVHSGSTLPIAGTVTANQGGAWAVSPAESWTVGVRSGGILPVVGSVQASQAGTWTVQATSGGTLPVLLAQTSGRVPVQIDVVSGGVLPVGVVSGAIFTTESVWASQQGSWQVRITSGGTIPVTVVGGGASDGAILDGSDGTVKATVYSLAGDNPLGVALVNAVGSFVAPTSLGGTFVGSVQASQAGTWTVTLGASSGDVPVTGQVRVTSGGILPVVGSVGATQLGAPWSFVGSAQATQQGSWDVRARGAATHDAAYPDYPFPLAGYAFAGNSRAGVTSGDVVGLLADLEGRLRVKVDTTDGPLGVALASTSGRVPVQVDASSGAFLVSPAESWTVGVRSGGVLPVTPSGSWTVGVSSGGILPVVGSVGATQLGTWAVQATSGGTLPVTPSGSWFVGVLSGGTLPVTFAGGITGSVQATQQGSWTYALGSIQRRQLALSTDSGTTLTTWTQTVARAGSFTLVASGLENFRRAQLIICCSPAPGSFQVRYGHAITSGTWLWQDILVPGSAALVDFNVVAPYGRLVIELPSSHTYMQGALYAIPIA